MELSTLDFELRPRFLEECDEAIEDVSLETMTGLTVLSSSPLKTQLPAPVDVTAVEDADCDYEDGLLGGLDDEAAFYQFFSGVKFRGRLFDHFLKIYTVF